MRGQRSEIGRISGSVMSMWRCICLSTMTYAEIHLTCLFAYMHMWMHTWHVPTYTHTYILTYLHKYLYYITYVTLHYIQYITLHYIRYIHYITCIHTYIHIYHITLQYMHACVHTYMHAYIHPLALAKPVRLMPHADEAGHKPWPQPNIRSGDLPFAG